MAICEQNSAVAQTIQSYPKGIRRRILALRELILVTAEDIPEIESLEETLKWGEPSYLAKGGSTVRLSWTASKPGYYAINFNCNTRLVDAFREVYADIFRFEGNRAIVFHKADAVPTKALKHCISVSLQYHKLKRFPLLGM